MTGFQSGIEEKFETTVGDHINWQWRLNFFCPVESTVANWTSRKAIVRRKQGLRPPFQYPLKWRLRAHSPLVTRAEFIRVSCKLYVEPRTWREKVRIPRIEIARFIFLFSLSFSRGWRSLIRVSLHICRCIGSMQPTIWGTKRHRNEGYESPSEKSVSTYRWEL